MGIYVNSGNLKIAPIIFPDLIRIGNEGDGGYVLPKSATEGVDTLISFGIGSNWTFESSIEKLIPAIKIYGFDHTVSLPYFIRKSLNGFIKGLINRSFSEHFNPRFLRAFTFIQFWIMRKNMTLLQIEITQQNVLEIVKKYSKNSIIGIKIDIEGGEYEILPMIIDVLKLAKFLIVEFHNIELNRDRFEIIIDALSNFQTIAHLHCNNFDSVGLNGFPKTVELTFVNNNIQHDNEKRLALPLNNLDYPNAKNRPDFSICFVK